MNILIGLLARILWRKLDVPFELRLSEIDGGKNTRDAVTQLVARALAARKDEERVAMELGQRLSRGHSGSLRVGLALIAQAYQSVGSSAQRELVSRYGDLSAVAAANALYQALEQAMIEYQSESTPELVFVRVPRILRSDAARELASRGGEPADEMYQDIAFAMLELAYPTSEGLPNEAFVSLLEERSDIFAPLHHCTRPYVRLFIELCRVRKHRFSGAEIADIFIALKREEHSFGEPFAERMWRFAVAALPGDLMAKQEIGRRIEAKDPDIGCRYLEAYWRSVRPPMHEWAVIEYFAEAFSPEFRNACLMRHLSEPPTGPNPLMALSDQR
ncbi:MAG: hypothetical protein IT290_02395 [Deltaproteobacteria bacterium]|nr:hypothetical protein [Deltaproteobacteria bacterium]